MQARVVVYGLPRTTVELTLTKTVVHRESCFTKWQKTEVRNIQNNPAGVNM